MRIGLPSEKVTRSSFDVPDFNCGKLQHSIKSHFPRMHEYPPRADPEPPALQNALHSCAHYVRPRSPCAEPSLSAKTNISPHSVRKWSHPTYSAKPDILGEFRDSHRLVDVRVFVAEQEASENALIFASMGSSRIGGA